MITNFEYLPSGCYSLISLHGENITAKMILKYFIATFSPCVFVYFSLETFGTRRSILFVSFFKSGVKLHVDSSPLLITGGDRFREYRAESSVM